MTTLFNPPAAFELPLTKGQGLSVDFQNTPGGTATPYTDTFGDDVTVTLYIESAETLTQAATLNAEHAVISIQPQITDTIPGGAVWRLVIASTTVNPPVVPCNGRVERFDG